MKFWVNVEGHESVVEIDQRNGAYVVSVDGKERLVNCRNVGDHGFLSLLIENRSYLVETAPLRADEGQYYANINGRHYEIDVMDERLRAAKAAGALVKETGPYVVSSPMPGLIVDVKVSVGDHVKAGTALVIMEAMKMQNQLTASIDGVVKAINVAPQDTVDSQAPLVEIERVE